MKDYNKFFETVYEQHDIRPVPNGWIQWKGTDVCMDVYCACGYHGHVDVDFFYFYECPKCHQKYAVGQTVPLIPLTPELIALGGITEDRFVTCDLEED
jgi:hypothetical protein